MAANVAKAEQSIPLNSIDLRCAKASIEINRPENTAPIEAPDFDLSLVVEAIGEAGMQDKEFAINGGLDCGQWSRIKGGVGNLHAKVLLRQPAKFWIALNRLHSQQLGITHNTETEVRQQMVNDTADALWDRLVECFRKGTEK